MNIRLMRESDIAAAVAVGINSYGDEYVPLFNANIESDLRDMFSTAAKRPRFFVVSAGEEIIAFAGWGRSWLNWRMATFCYCHVALVHQGHGIGRALTDHRVADIKKQAPDVSIVLVNTWATDMYIGYGFVPLAAAHGDNGHLMRLDIARYQTKN